MSRFDRTDGLDRVDELDRMDELSRDGLDQDGLDRVDGEDQMDGSEGLGFDPYNRYRGNQQWYDRDRSETEADADRPGPRKPTLPGVRWRWSTVVERPGPSADGDCPLYQDVVESIAVGDLYTDVYADLYAELQADLDRWNSADLDLLGPMSLSSQPPDPEAPVTRARVAEVAEVPAAEARVPDGPAALDQLGSELPVEPGASRPGSGRRAAQTRGGSHREGRRAAGRGASSDRGRHAAERAARHRIP